MIQGGSASVVRADAGALPLRNSSIDLVVTSPPYWSLRSYMDGDRMYDGQIGAEPTPREYVDNLIRCTREWMRVLKPSGSIFVNLGDKYNAYNANRGDGRIQRNHNRQSVPSGHGLDVKGVPNKSLLLLPERYRIACLDELGLVVRSVTIWDKPNGMPESVRDRVRRSHEDWVHLTLGPRYYADVKGPRGSVWRVPTRPFRPPASLGIKHSATFPLEWPRRLIDGWCPPGGTVLDPFAGSGTTALVAKMMGCHGVAVEMSQTYCDLATWRLESPKEIDRALREGS